MDNVISKIANSALKGAASGGGTISSPFKAAQAGISSAGNAIKGIKKYNYNKRMASSKPHYKKKSGLVAPNIK